MIDSQLFFQKYTLIHLEYTHPTTISFHRFQRHLGRPHDNVTPRWPTFLGCCRSFGIARLGGGTDGCCYPGNLVGSISSRMFEIFHGWEMVQKRMFFVVVPKKECVWNYVICAEICGKPALNYSHSWTYAALARWVHVFSILGIVSYQVASYLAY